MTPNTDAPDTDSYNAVYYDSPYPYYLRYLKNNKNNMTPNTDAPDYDTPDADDDDASSPNYFILDSYLKRKIDPKSVLKLLKKSSN